MSIPIHKAVKLTFVPNSFCNLGCTYCYLGRLTDRREKTADMALNFTQIAAKLKNEGVVLSEVILHGAELTAAPAKDVENLLIAIDEYRSENSAYIGGLTHSRFGENYISLKSNLYNFDIFYDLFLKFKVSVGGSVDVPLKMHEKYRVLKNGKSSLEKTLANLKLFVNYPYHRSISTTMSVEHLDAKAFIEDIYRLEKLGLDMVNGFYIMFAYQSANARGKFLMSNEAKMMEFYEALRTEFDGTKFEKAMDYSWFREFLGGYCTNMTNCGKEQVLMQKNGDTYICHRSQALSELKAGNIHEQSLENLMQNSSLNIQRLENNLELDKDCMDCDYFHLCKASCPIERKDTKMGKSYTCALQKAIYKKNPLRFKADKTLAQRAIDEFLRQNQIGRHKDKLLPNITAEFFERQNDIEALIKKDENLKMLYDKTNFLMAINDEVCELNFEKEALQHCFSLSEKDKIILLVNKKVLEFGGVDLPNQAVFLSLLRNTSRVYGDEKRLKMDHITNTSIYEAKLREQSEDLGEYYAFDLMPFLKQNEALMLKGVENELHVMTHALRDYHYKKHAHNAFYHAQTINLPFAFLRFFWQKGNED